MDKVIIKNLLARGIIGIRDCREPLCIIDDELTNTIYR
jgi:hypothetical protein